MIITKLLTTGALALALTLPAITQGSGSQRTPDTRFKLATATNKLAERAEKLGESAIAAQMRKLAVKLLLAELGDGTRQTSHVVQGKRKPHTPRKRTIGYDLRKYRLRPCAPRKGDCVRAH